MITLLCHSKYWSPASKIAQELKDSKGSPAQVVSTGVTELRRQRAYRRVSQAAKEDNSVLIRYGSMAFPEMDKQFSLVLNTAESIGKASDKFGSLKTLKDGKVPVIPNATAVDYLHKIPVKQELGNVLVARKLHHFGGKDIQVVDLTLVKGRKDFDRLLDADYVMKLIPNTKEYRVWAYHTRSFKPEDKARPIVFKAAEKVDKGEVDRTQLTGAKAIIKNHHNGYAFVFHDDIPDTVRSLGRKALGLFDLDFAAIDIMQDLDTGSFYVLELNTAPGCASQATTTAFAEKFDRSARYLVGENLNATD